MANDSYGTFSPESKIPYDPLWKGPLLKNRHCTNRFWLIAFFAFLAVWALTANYAFSNGDIRRLIVPTDSNGRKCGIDIDVKDKPYLVFFDLTKCSNGSCDTPQVCQASCPTEDFLYKSDIPLSDIKAKVICKSEINVTLITSPEQVDNYITQNKCAKWYLKSEPIIGRCIPKGPVPIEFSSIISNDQLNKTSQVILQIAEIEKRLENIYQDIIATGCPVLGFIALSGLAAFLYIFLLRWLAKPFVYISILIICSLLVFFIYESSIQYSIKNSSEWLYALIFSIVLLIIIVLSTMLLHKKIDIACQIIKESSKAVGCIWSSLLFPVIPWILHLFVIILAATVLFYLQTITIPNYTILVQDDVLNTCSCPSQLNYVNNATCDPNIFNSECKDVNGGACSSTGCYLTSVTTPKQIYVYHLINALAFLWLSFFVSAFEHMVLAVIFATWYWTFTKHNIPRFTVIRGFWITLRYHVGTVAFGSLIMWLCDLVRLILKPVVSTTQSNGPISIQPAGCIRSLFDFLMSFLQYINRNAYTMCAIHGRGFCHSARDAFNLITRNIVRVVVVTNITDWLLRIAKYFIVVLTVALTMAYYSNKGPDVVSGIEVPIAMALIGSYLVTTAFFSVHKAAVHTLFLCFLEDIERNDGSQDKPFYMSMKLRQLLQK